MTAQEYLAEVPVDRLPHLTSLREMILSSFPEVEETMDYNMPTYIQNGETLCALANQERYLALYIMPYDLLDQFGEELKKFKGEASCIMFEKLDETDVQVFGRILKYCAENYPKSQYFGRMNASKK